MVSTPVWISVNPRRRDSQEEPANRALIVVVILLLLAIIAVVIYIAVRVIGPTTVPNENTKPGQTQSTQSTQLGQPEVPCTELAILPVVTLENVGDTWTVSVTKQEPANTTDKIEWSSADAAVATVSQEGVVTAVGVGRTTVTAKCGAIVAECSVIVGGGEQPDDPTQPPEPAFELKLNREDFSLSKYGEKWNLYNGTVSAEEITWTSDDPSICTIEKGVVTAVAPGETKVHAQYNGQTVSCIVRCGRSVVPPTGDPSIKILPSEDVTITVGESFNLRLVKSGAEGEADQVLSVTWTASKDGIVTIDGNKITGAAVSESTGIKVSATYEGNTYECIVRVKAAS